MKTKLSFLILMFSGVLNLQAQNYSIYANGYNTDTIQVCYSDTVTLLAGNGSVIFFDDFNSGTLDPLLWSSNTTPTFTNPCGQGPDGSICAWIGNATCFPRDITTQPISVSPGSQVCFDLKFAIQGNSSPCEGPDEMDEGVSLQYSTNGGISWSDIIYFCPDGNLYSTNSWVGQSTSGTSVPTNFTSWGFYCFNVPSAAVSSNTFFRWYQEQVTSADNDHWGIDNVSITSSSSNAEWTGPNSFYSTDSPLFLNAVLPGMYYLTVTDSTGVYTDSIYIDVVGSPISFSGLNSVYCSSADSVLITVNPLGTQISGNGISGNYFYPSQVSGDDTIWFSLPTAYSFNYQSTLVIWEDDFSQDLGWTGDISVWQRDAISSPTNGCPTSDYTLSNTDNYIIGTNVNNYYTANLSTTSWMMSPSIDLTGKTNCKLQFYSASSFGANDTAKIQVFDGVTWYELPYNENNYSTWHQVEYDVSAYADNNPDFKIMFGIGPTSATVNECGWNIDDIKIISDTIMESSGTCSVDTFFPVNVPVSSPAPEICMVTNDTVSHHNMVIWDNAVYNAQLYYIYRETPTAGVFELLDSLAPTNSNYYIDSSSIPDQQSYKYKLAFMDSCGNLSAQSQYHRTIHLTVSSGSPQGFNLIWEPYEGYYFSSYIIYRGTNSGQMISISSVSSGTTIFTDLNPPIGSVFYMVTVQKSDSCEIQSGQYISQSLSNISHVIAGASIHTLDNTLTILPNPNNGQVQLQMTNNFTGKFNISIFDNLGRKVLVREFTKSGTQFSQNLDLSNLANGIYQIQVNMDGNKIIQKMVVQK